MGQQVEDFHAALPGSILHRLWSTLPSKPFDATFWRQELNNGVHGYSIKDRSITAEFMKGAHRHMLAVISWIVDSESTTVDEFDEGVDGYIGNMPDLLLQLVRK